MEVAADDLEVATDFELAVANENAFDDDEDSDEQEPAVVVVADDDDGGGDDAAEMEE